MTPRRFHCQVYLETDHGAELTVVSLGAIEGLDRGHEVTVEATTDAPFDPAELLGQTASIVLSFDEERTEQRSFHGYVFDSHIRTEREDLYRVRLILRARLDLLGLGRNSRIFQEQTIEDILSTLLDEAGLSGGYEWHLGGRYQPRPYVVQYNESDLEFLNRLVADEGIAYAVRNDEDADRVVFFDDSTVLPEIEGETVILDRSSMRAGVEVVLDSLDTFRATSDAVMLRDYDYANPATDLSANSEGDNSAGREVYVHPGNFLDVGTGQQRAERALESLQQHGHRFEGESDCPRFEPGKTFSLLEHSHAGTDADYLLIEVKHHVELYSEGGRSVTYKNAFLCQPVEVSYRPPISMERPHPGGIQNAFVTVPSGGEIHSNDSGCVKVRFPWDRSGITDDKSSTWLRVGQYALGGSMTIPRGGFETLVDFELGDIDRPLVVGHLYNGEAKPPYELPANATRSSFQTATTEGGEGANEMRFDDTAGSEEIFINASYDYITSIANDANVNVAANDTYDVGSNRSVGVTSNFSQKVDGDETIDIGGNQNINVTGDFSAGTGGSQSVSIGANRMMTIGTDLTEEIGGSLTRDVGALQSITGLVDAGRKVVGSSTTTVAAALGEVVGGSRALTVNASYSESVGALKMIKATAVGVNCDAAYACTAAAETVKAGGGRTDKAKGAVAVTAGGGMKVKAADITITAKSKLVFRGGAISVTLTSGGSVTIKAPTVKIKTSKVLSQAMHQSG